ncbi:MAG: hypothetical protein ACXWO1_14005, partial [Isosphaeraceae bacterium]
MTRRDKMTAVLGAMVGVLSMLMPVPGALGQTAPGYQELFPGSGSNRPAYPGRFAQHGTPGRPRSDLDVRAR